MILSPQRIEKNDVCIQIHPKYDHPVECKANLLPPQIIIHFGNQRTLVQSKMRQHYKPLKLHFVLHDYPPKFLDYLPKFSGENHVTKEQHMDAFQCWHK